MAITATLPPFDPEIRMKLFPIKLLTSQIAWIDWIDQVQSVAAKRSDKSLNKWQESYISAWKERKRMIL